MELDYDEHSFEGMMLLQVATSYPLPEESRMQGRVATNTLDSATKGSNLGTRSISEAPSGRRILDAYEACSLRTAPYLENAEVIFHNESKTRFIHIYKNAGLAIKESIQGWSVAPWQSKLEGNTSTSFMGDPRDAWLAQQTFFAAALVRDPLQRSLSGFHEVYKRSKCCYPVGVKDHDCDNCEDYSGGETVRDWINLFNYSLGQVQISLGTHAYDTAGITAHMWPQMSFLTWRDGSHVELDYIGQMDGDLEDEFRWTFNTVVPMIESDGHSLLDTDRFRIQLDELPADVIVKVCTVYKVDYCCFGYDFPDACKTAGFKCDGHA